MKRAQVIAVLTLVLLCPRPAFAGRSFWGWLEEMSGPGPFRGTDVTFTVLCDYGPRRLHSCSRLPPTTVDRDATHPIVGTLVVKIGRYTSSENDPRFKDRPLSEENNQGKVLVRPLSVIYMARRGPFDFGPGIGVWRISADSGADFPAFTKLVLTPMTAAVSPLALVPDWKNRLWARALRLEVDTSYVVGGFSADNFKNSHTTFKAPHEFLTRAAIVVDLGALLWPK